MPTSGSGSGYTVQTVPTPPPPAPDPVVAARKAVSSQQETPKKED